jgi:hypothetical protein
MDPEWISTGFLLLLGAVMLQLMTMATADEEEVLDHELMPPNAEAAEAHWVEEGAVVVAAVAPTEAEADELITLTLNVLYT